MAFKDTKRPTIERHEDTDASGTALCYYSTAGMSIMGTPEVVVAWPAELHDAASGIVEDLMLSAMNGDVEKFEVERKVFAQRFGIGYTIVDASGSSDYLPQLVFLKEHTQRRPGVPFVVRLDMVLDTRDGVDLPGM